MIKHLSGPLAVAALALLAPMTVQAASSDPLGCDATIHDPDGELDADALQPTIESTAASLAADLRVRVEPKVYGDLDGWIDGLVHECPGWEAADGELADDMVVVTFSPADRQAGVYYGADHGPRLESHWESAVDAMIDEFRDGDYTAGVEAGLSELRTPASFRASYSA